MKMRALVFDSCTGARAKLPRDDKHSDFFLAGKPGILKQTWK